MKSKLKTLEIISVSMIFVLTAYLIHLNLIVSDYEATMDYSFKGNYVQIEKNTSLSEDIVNEANFVEFPGIELAIEEQEPVVEEPEQVLYDGKTVDEIAEILDRSLNSDIAGKGYLIASHSIEMGVDPYMATAIILQETGCKWECSTLVKSCNNVGGQKGQGCGSYSSFDTLDNGIIAFIDNLYNNYISYGLTTPETINPKYAESQTWSQNVNRYIESIKAE